MSTVSPVVSRRRLRAARPATATVVATAPMKTNARLRDRLALGAVVAASLATAAAAYVLFLSDARYLWNRIDHDRNFHYLAGLRLGIDLRSGDLVQFFVDFFSLRTWPPLHALLVGAATAVGGPHFQPAVLPSLLGWCGTAVLTFLIVRRLTNAASNLGGMVAASFVLLAPAYRAFATDVMLESLGAFFTLLVLYYYVADRQGGVRCSRGFALALTGLFFLKYNYWGLTIMALASAECWIGGRRTAVQLLEIAKSVPWRSWLLRQLRQPLNYVVAALLLLILTGEQWGGRTFELFGKPIRLGRSTQNLWQFALVAAVVRAAVAWRSEGRTVWSAMSAPVRRICLWHALPIVAWFILPKRLGYFLWYAGTENGPNSDSNFLNGIEFYRETFVADYHFAPWAAVVAAALVVVGLATILLSRCRVEARVFVCLLLIGTATTAVHPNRKSRFLHSWLPTAWIAAGIGVASLAAARGSSKFPRLRPVLVGGAAMGLVAAQAQGFVTAGHAPDSDRRPHLSTLDVVDVYRPWLADVTRAAVFTTMPGEHFADWSYLEAFPNRPRPETQLPKWFTTAHDANRAQFDAWLAKTDVERIVLVDIRSGSPFYLDGFEPHRDIVKLLDSQADFVKADQRSLGNTATVTLWQRATPRR